MSTPSKVPELLAPAGGRAQFFAALNAGADAVYLGLKEFNARARAENFTVDDLRELMPLAHRYGLKVLVTVNVLIKDTELPKLIDELSSLEELGVHAIIVQDLAVARIVKHHFPKLRLHASTQMAVHNLAGVMQAWRYGFRRVVLARELTALEIKRIRQAVPEGEIELEAFCHGSLCYSYSGLCFFSGANDARSGNRGECAYTCRQPYKILNEPGHGFLFSMRDLDSSADLESLVGTGIDTLKIEGRKKDAQYVATVVKLYRRRLDEVFGRSTLRAEAPPEARATATDAELRSDLSFSFHRSPTTFFLKGRYYENVIDLDNPTHLGLRVGEITQVLPDTIRVKIEIPLERFDGLRVAAGAQVFDAMVKNFGHENAQFPLREMRVDGAWTPTARAGQCVEIALTDAETKPRRGDILYKVRSADSKRRIHKLEAPPADARVKALSFVSVHVSIAEREGDLVIAGRVTKLGELLTEARVAVAKTPSRGESTFAGDLRSIMAQFGDQGFLAEELTVEGELDGLFVPRAKLKELKHLLAEGLTARYGECVDGRKKKAHAALAESAPPESLPSDRRFSVKVDRLEALADLAGFVGENPSFHASEVIFEPKRAFLPALDPETLTRSLLEFTAKTGVPARIAFPMVIRAWDEPLLKRWFTHAAASGLRRFEAGNVGALQYLEDWELLTEATDLASDFTLYAMNTVATRFWSERGVTSVTLSVEDDLTNLKSHLARWPWELPVRPRAILFKDTPLFIAEACSLTALHNGCPTAKVCGYRTLEIESPAGERYFVAHESCKSIVYAKEAYSLTHRQGALYELGVRDFRIDFLTRPYPREAMASVLLAAWHAAPIAGTHTANFDRTLL